MRKVLSIYLPNWATDLVRRQWRRSGGSREKTPPAILLTRETHGRAIIVKRCEIAAAAGVNEGMCLTDARALLGDRPLHIAAHQPVRDRQRLAALANWALRFAPLVQADGDDGLLLDVTGCGRIYGGQKRVVRHIAGAIERLGFTVHAALASSVGAAWAMSHYGAGGDLPLPGGPPLRVAAKRGANEARRSTSSRRWFIIPDDRVKEMLAPLPLAALRLDEPTQIALHEVAVDTVGELLAIDRGELADRFDDSLLRRLDEALGGSFEPIDPAEPVEPPMVERRFAGPVKQVEAIEITVRGLLELLAAELERSHLGARVIEVAVERYDAPPLKEQVTLSRPAADAAHFWTLWSPKVERLNLGHGVEVIRLTAAQTQRLDHDQDVIWADDPTRRAAPTDEAMGRFVDRMISRLGPEHVCRVTPIETHAPEAAFAHEPWEERSVFQRARACRSSPRKRGTQNAPRETPLVSADRPSQLHRRPKRVDVVCLSPDGPVVSMRHGPRHHRILTSIGPERIAGRWWLLSDPAAAIPQRDYFKVQDEEGAWWWIYRETETTRWWLHGSWS